ncbi:hypothetical protein [Cellulomonas persica]|uniref:Uncharacterized protein n=1 Tax=Cellulomonas persica TaxID=76861 RepID=A0A510UVN4_9CELL|nr:hypothetical protein [Cellulomonas persica]GEK16865.1 hypothetical protein CPE01_05980 [Cellulomonas persica]
MTEPITPTAGVPSSTWPNVKVARAAQHLSELQARIGLWFATSPFYGDAVVADDRLSWSMRLHVLSPPPLDEWGAYVGDCVHNLRSALDAAVWDLATSGGREPSSPTWISFPIVTTAERWRGVPERNLDGLPADAIERIWRIQPFQRPAAEQPGDALAILQRLDNDDKHRSKIVAQVAAVEMGHDWSVEFADDAAAGRNVPPDTTLHAPDLTDGAVLMVNRTVDPIVKVRGSFALRANLVIETPMGPQQLIETLGSLISYVDQILAIVYGRVELVGPGTADATE